MTAVFLTGVIVRAAIPAETADEAIEMLCDAIRGGIGPEPRQWELAIAASRVQREGAPPEYRLNEALLTDLARENHT